MRICLSLVIEATLKFWQCIVQDTKYKFQKVLVQDGDIGRSWTDLHPQTESIATYGKPPFEKKSVKAKWQLHVKQVEENQKVDWESEIESHHASHLNI